jgi:hypothetical protein
MVSLDFLVSGGEEEGRPHVGSMSARLGPALNGSGRGDASHGSDSEEEGSLEGKHLW